MLDLQSQLTSSNNGAVSTTAGRSRRPLEDTQTQGRKLAVASVQGLDQLRKLVLPDALLSIIGDALPGTRSRERNGSEMVTTTNGGGTTTTTREAKKEGGENLVLKEALDTLLASSCVLCDGAIASIDRPFVGEGEEM